MKLYMHFVDEMTGKVRWSSREVRASCRFSYFKLFTSRLPEHQENETYYYEMITALRLAELPKKRQEE